MELEGKVWKSKKLWLIEVSSLDVMTQGRSRKEALKMLKDAIVELARSYYKSEAAKNFEVTVTDYGKNTIGVGANDSNLLLSFLLKRQREIAGSTIKEAAKRLGSGSPNAYAQYEKGSVRPSMDKYGDLLHAANPSHRMLLRVI